MHKSNRSGTASPDVRRRLACAFALAAACVVLAATARAQTPGIIVNPTSGLVTAEDGDTATFTVVLNTAPTANVTIGLTSSDTSEGTVSPASMTFTSGDWSMPQTVTVTGQDDAVADGDVVYTIITEAATSGDFNYNGRDAADVSVTNTDDDTAGITVSPTSGLVTTEAGGQATFTVVLDTEPPGLDVTIGLSSSDTGEGTVSPASVTFAGERVDLRFTYSVLMGSKNVGGWAAAIIGSLEVCQEWG